MARYACLRVGKRWMDDVLGIILDTLQYDVMERNQGGTAKSMVILSNTIISSHGGWLVAL